MELKFIAVISINYIEIDEVNYATYLALNLAPGPDFYPFFIEVEDADF